MSTPIVSSLQDTEPAPEDLCAICGNDPGGTYYFSKGKHYCTSHAELVLVTLPSGECAWLLPEKMVRR